ERLFVIEPVLRIRPRQDDAIRRIGSRRRTVRDIDAWIAARPRAGHAVEGEITLHGIEYAHVRDVGDRPRDLEGLAAIEGTRKESHALVLEAAVPEDIDDAVAIGADAAALSASGATLIGDG